MPVARTSERPGLGMDSSRSGGSEKLRMAAGYGWLQSERKLEADRLREERLIGAAQIMNYVVGHEPLNEEYK